MKKILLFTIGLLVFTGCATKQEVVTCEPEIRYLTEYKVQKVNVPVKCKIPEYDCNFNGNSSGDIVAGMLQCIKKQKEIIELCR